MSFKQAEIAEYIRQLLDKQSALESRIKQLEQANTQWEQPQVPFAGSGNALDPQRYEVCIVSSTNPDLGEVVGYRTLPNTAVNTPWQPDVDLLPITAKVPYNKPLPEVGETIVVFFNGTYGVTSTPLYGHFPASSQLLLVQLDEDLIHRETEEILDDAPSAMCVRVRYYGPTDVDNPNEYVGLTDVTSPATVNPNAILVYLTTGFRRFNPNDPDRDLSFGHSPLTNRAPSDGLTNVLREGDRAYATYNSQSGRYEFVHPAESIIRFSLATELEQGGVAQGYVLYESSGQWLADEEQAVPLWDRFNEWGPAEAGCRGYAKRFGDTGQWEIILLQSNCGSMSSSSRSLSSRSSSSSSPSSGSSESSGSSGSSGSSESSGSSGSSGESSPGSPSPSYSPTPSSPSVASPPSISPSPSASSGSSAASSTTSSAVSSAASSDGGSPSGSGEASLSECSFEYVSSLAVNFNTCSVAACYTRITIRGRDLSCSTEEVPCTETSSAGG